MTVQALGDGAGARAVLGPAYEPMLRYAELLVSEGVPRGLIGPHEPPRLWERHLLNSAALAGLLPPEGHVVDLGSGAGLPGVVLALCVPTVRMTLVDATRRRTEFLSEVVAELDLADRVEVVWGRAEEVAPLGADVVVARAVAPLRRLAEWALPHLVTGGSLLAMKGESAADELNRDRTAVLRLGAATTSLETLEAAGEPVRVLRVVKAATVGRPRPARASRPQAATSASSRAASRRRLPRSTAEKE